MKKEPSGLKSKERAQKIKALRKALDMNQQEFAESLAIGQAAVSALELGKNASAETFVRLGNLAPYPDSLWFWEQAQIDPQAMLSAAERILKERGTRAAKGEIIHVPIVQKTTGGMEKTTSSLPLPARYIKNPGSTNCLIVGQEKLGFALKARDVIAWDASITDTKKLWDEVVLFDFMRQREWREKGGNWDLLWPEGLHVGQLRIKRYDRGFMAEIWQVSDEREGGRPLQVGFLQHENLPPTLGYVYAEEAARRELKVYSACRILGRVVACLRSSGHAERK